MLLTNNGLNLVRKVMMFDADYDYLLKVCFSNILKMDFIHAWHANNERELYNLFINDFLNYYERIYIRLPLL